MIRSLVSTTAVGFNLFLGGAMATGRCFIFIVTIDIVIVVLIITITIILVRDLRSAQRGIAFSCSAAFVVSLLILMVGAGNFIKVLLLHHDHHIINGISITISIIIITIITMILE